MEPEFFHGHFQVIHTAEGDIVTPEQYAEHRGNEEAAAAYDVTPDDVETVFGWGWRLTTLGHLDCTEWSLADSKLAAIAECLGR